MLIAAGNLLVSSVIWGVATYGSTATPLNPFFSWLTVLLAAIVSAQLILLAISMLLLEFRRSLRWVTTLLILAVAAGSMATGHVVGYNIARGTPNYAIFLSPPRQLAVNSAFALTLGVTIVLGLQVLLWPLAASLGWRLRSSEETLGRANPRFSLLQLFGWIGFIAALLSLIRTLAALDNWWFMILVFSLFWMLPALLAAMPTLLMAARAVRRPWWLALLVSYLGIVSYLESEFTAILFGLGITGTWWPVWILLVFNGGVATTVFADTLLVRICGYVPELPLWPRRVPACADRSSRWPVTS
jgi:hypothetical protein